MPSSLRVTSTASLSTMRGEFGRGLGDLGLGRDRPMHRGGQLLAVRRDQRRAAIDAVIVALGIDNHRLAEARAPRR